MAKAPTPVCLFVVRVPDIDTIGLFTQCSGLEMKVDVFEYAEGGNNEFVHQLPGQVSYPNLVLERGLTNEDAVLKWFNATRSQPQLKEVTITLKSPGDAARLLSSAWSGSAASLTFS